MTDIKQLLPTAIYQAAINGFLPTSINPFVTLTQIDALSNIPTNTILGRYSAGVGISENITIGSGLNLSGLGILSVITSTWLLIGNSGTNVATDFIGTTDAIDLITKTNNVERIRVTSTGNVGIGITPTTALHVGGSDPTLTISASLNSRTLILQPSNGAIDSTNASLSLNRYSGNGVSIGFSSNSQLRIGQATPTGIGTSANNGLLYLGNTGTTPVGQTIFEIDTPSTSVNDIIKISSTTGTSNNSGSGFETGNLLIMKATGNIGIGDNGSITSAKVSITSTTQGFLPPRMTTAQRNAIIPVAGLIVFDNVLNTFQGFDGTNWLTL